MVLRQKVVFFIVGERPRANGPFVCRCTPPIIKDNRYAFYNAVTIEILDVTLGKQTRHTKKPTKRYQLDAPEKKNPQPPGDHIALLFTAASSFFCANIIILVIMRM